MQCDGQMTNVSKNSSITDMARPQLVSVCGLTWQRDDHLVIMVVEELIGDDLAVASLDLVVEQLPLFDLGEVPRDDVRTGGRRDELLLALARVEVRGREVQRGDVVADHVGRVQLELDGSSGCRK